MLNIEKSCCFTGYRPEKFNFPFNTSSQQYVQLVGRLLSGVVKKINLGCTTFYTGMARGFDILAAEQVAAIKLRRPEIKLVAVVPFNNMQLSFSPEWRERFDRVLSECDEVVILNEKYEKWVYQQRNEYMVDCCRHVICYFDGSKGGTANTVKYALAHCREIENICEKHPFSDEMIEYSAFYKLIPPDEE